MKKVTLHIVFIMMFTSGTVFCQSKNPIIQLQKFTNDQRWETAESNIVYFIISGISYAKSNGSSAASYGTWTGTIGLPYWKSIVGMTPEKFVQEIYANEDQFKDYRMEILENNSSVIKGKVKGMGLKWLKMMDWGRVTIEDYEQFFRNKWKAIANGLGYDYDQQTKGDWTYFTITKKIK
jgi:hypothetical protein